MIERIDGLGSVRTTQPVKRVAKSDSSSSAGFAKHLDESSETSPSGGVLGADPISGILGVQEVDDALSHASKGKRRAKDILDKLDEMRLDLLAGTLSKDKLLQLTQLVTARRSQITDPKLSALLDEIDLRAQVELAKYAP